MGGATFGQHCVGEVLCVTAAKPVTQLCDLAEIMNSGKAFEVLLHVRRQSVVGRGAVREEGVATHIRQDFRLCERPHRRLFKERFIGVPHRGGVARFGIKDAYMLVSLAEVWEKSVNLDLADPTAKCHVLIGGEVRGSQKQHFVLNKCVVNGIDGLGIEIAAEIDVGDLGAEAWSELAEFHVVMLTLFGVTRRFAGLAARGRPIIWGLRFMTNLFNYSGKRVVLTGGATGIGAALADLLGELGVEHLTILDIKAPTGRCDTFIETNLADPASIDAAIAQIEGPIDVLFSNAGVAANAGVRTCMAVNVAASRRLTDALIGRITKGGTIVYTASMAGNGWPAQVAEITELLEIADWDAFLDWCEAHPEVVNDVYAFSKMCMQVYTMRRSYSAIREGIRINSICPAPVDTPLMADFKVSMGEDAINWAVGVQGNGRMAVATDIAPSLAFMGSDAAAFINGENLHVDSGLSSAMVTGLAFS